MHWNKKINNNVELTNLNAELKLDILKTILMNNTRNSHWRRIQMN